MAGGGAISATYQVSILAGDNFLDWKENILFTLGVQDLDLCFRVDEISTLSDQSTPAEKTHYERWERSNRLSLMFIKKHISKSIRGSIPDKDEAVEYMKSVEEQFVRSDKALASTLIKKFCNKTFDPSKGVREHIMEYRDIASKLNDKKMGISEAFLVYYILQSLPSEYDPFKISYNTHKDDWKINDLVNFCVEEEERLASGKLEMAHFVTSKKKRYAKKGKDSLGVESGKSFKHDSDGCYFCKKKGHKRRDCIKFKQWLEKKGISERNEAEKN